MNKHIVSLIHPYYVEYGIVSPMHIIDKEISSVNFSDFMKKVKKQYPKYQIYRITKMNLDKKFIL